MSKTLQMFYQCTRLFFCSSEDLSFTRYFLSLCFPELLLFTRWMIFICFGWLLLFVDWCWLDWTKSCSFCFPCIDDRLNCTFSFASFYVLLACLSTKLCSMLKITSIVEGIDTLQEILWFHWDIWQGHEPLANFRMVNLGKSLEKRICRV